MGAFSRSYRNDQGSVWLRKRRLKQYESVRKASPGAAVRCTPKRESGWSWNRSWQQEAAQELVKIERQQPLLVAVSRITPAEGDPALLERDQALVRDRHTMGVTAQVLQSLPRPSEGRPHFDDPLGAVQGSHKGLERRLSIEGREPPVEAQLALDEGFVETVDELAAENLGEDLLR